MKKVLLIISICLCELCYSQEAQKVFLQLEDDISYDKSTLDNTLKQLLSIDSQLSTEVYKEEISEEENSTLLRLHEKLGEYRILEGNLLVYVKDEKITRINGTYYPSVELMETTPLLPESEILEIAENEVFGSQTGYDFQYEIEKVISKNYLDVDDKNLYFAYKVDVSDNNNIETYVEVVIDGTTGKILKNLSRHQTKENFSFVDDDMQWSYITVESWDENPDEPSGKLPATMTTTYKYFGDTIINSISYKKMYRTTDNGKNWSEFGYFRLEGKQVYYITKNEEKEKLVYNFSKDMELTFRIHPNKEHALKSDTIMVNNVKKARWGFYPKDGDSEAFYQDISLDDKYYFEDVIIEDIGSVFVPTFDGLRDCPRGMTGCPYYTYLLCVQKNGDVIWHNPNYEECYYERTAVETIENNLISLSPNPVKDILTLTLPTDNNEIKIFDLQGKLLLQQNVGFSAEIIVSMLPMGTYVLVVNGESYKFVKE